jgi:hypothetical protein
MIDPECPSAEGIASGGSVELEDLARQLVLQAKYSKCAAGFAMAAALSQFLLNWL